MRYKGNIYKAIVSVHCGTRSGTAFFVGPNVLLTARHVVIEAFRNKLLVKVVCNKVVYVCSKVEPLGKEGELCDVTLLKIKDYAHPAFIPLLSLPVDVDKPLFVAGYPLEIGKGADLFDFEIHHTEVVSDNCYDVVAAPKELIPFNSYKGFSGSPVITDDGFAVGLITDQLSRVVGYSSVVYWQDKMKAKKLNVYKNWEDYDKSAYGYGRSVEMVKRAALNAGDRYSPDIHVKNKKLENDLNIFCCKTEQERIKALYPSVESWYLRLKEKYPFVKDKYEKGQYADLAFCLQNFRENYNGRYIDKSLEDYKKVAKEDVDEIKNQFNILNEAFHSSGDLMDYKCAFMHGIAGSGKTHSLCWFAEHHEMACQPYLLYGGQYATNEDFIRRTEELLEFPDGLEGLDKYMEGKGRYAIIIVDAINEGIGLLYWKDVLARMPQVTDKYENIRFVFSARIPDNSDINVGDHNKWAVREVQGFYDYREAIDKYFLKFGVDNTLKNNPYLEFSNPLFLRTFCISYSHIPYHKRNTITKLELFLIYLNARNGEIARIVDEDPYVDITTDYLMKLAERAMENANGGEVTREEARKISEKMYPYRPWSQSLLYACLKETLLLESMGDDRNTPCVEFEFDNLGDFLKVAVFMDRGIKGADITSYLTKKKRLVGNNRKNKTRFVHFVGALLSVDDSFLNHFAKKALEGNQWNEELLDTLQYRGPLRQRIIAKFIEEGNNRLLPFLIREADAYTFAEAEALHKGLNGLKLSERDLRWSHWVNDLYDWTGRQQFQDIRLVELFEKNTNDDSKKKALVLIIWMLTSSYPELRTILIRHLVNAFTTSPDLVDVAIDLFKSCNDPYVLQGLYGAVYGATLRLRDKKKVKRIAKKVYSANYAVKVKKPNDWLVRYWTMKILERATYLDSGSTYWSEVKPPFDKLDNPYSLLNDSTPIDETYFGESDGSHILYYSLFKDSDFNRYIIGTNSSKTDRILVNASTNEAVLLDDITRMIGVRIKELGWSDQLGCLDNEKFSQYRFDNKTERIGKKYQWIAYFDIMGRLTDCCRMRMGRYGDKKSKFREVNYPWYADMKDHFDPTLNVKAYKSAIVQMKVVGDMKITGADDEDWIDNNAWLPSFRFSAKDEKGQEYIMLYGFDNVKQEDKDFAVISNAGFVKKSYESRFKKWCKTQNFYGRWMPERTGSTDFLWNEYPWADSYKASLEMEQWEQPSDDCPCKVMLSYEAQLQEQWDGIDYEDQYLTTVYMPCSEMMEEMKLYCSEIRGFVKKGEKGDKDEIVAVNLENNEGMTGLFVRKDVLDDYLNKTGYKMFYYVLGEKVQKFGELNSRMQDLSAAYQYKQGGNLEVIQPMRVVNK